MGIWILMREWDIKIRSFVYGDERRFFSNTDIRCKANCQYYCLGDAKLYCCFLFVKYMIYEGGRVYGRI